MVVAVIFTVSFKNDENAKVFLSAFRKMQKHVIENEPGTLLYELHQCFHEGKPVPLKYILLERYSSRFDFDEVHTKSAAFTEFFEQLNSLEIAEQNIQVLENGEIPKGSPLELGNDALQAEERHPLLRKGVLVFGGSRSGRDAAYVREAASLGVLLVRQVRRALVYGGGTFGMMGAVAKSVKSEGGTVITVIPRALCGVETSGEMIGDLVYYTDTMSERKSIMFACADIVVALPGGIGTFDELLEVLTLSQLHAYRTKIGLLNVNGFFEPFMALLKHLVAEEFLSDTILSDIIIASTADGLIDAMSKFELPPLLDDRFLWHVRP